VKLSTVFLIILAIQFNILIFDSGYNHQTAIFGFIQNPTSWSNTLFISLFGATAVAIALGAMVGSFFIKPDIMVFSGFVAIFISWCIPIASLWQIIYEETSIFGSASGLIASIIIAPLAVLAIFTIIGWWRGQSEM
jgi:hypothetical protein